jgi:hypothetical protein
MNNAPAITGTAFLTDVVKQMLKGVDIK